jgi:hypothetical protein
MSINTNNINLNKLAKYNTTYSITNNTDLVHK